MLGPGYVESVYEEALSVELNLRRIDYVRQVEALAPIHCVQLRSYLKATRCTLGLLINFNVPVLLRGVRRVFKLAEPGVLAFSYLNGIGSRASVRRSSRAARSLRHR